VISSVRTRARMLQRLLALLAAVILLLGHVPPALEAAPPDYDPTKVEPALQRALAERPDAKFQVIVTRQPAKDKSDRRAREAEVEADMKSDGGRIRRRLGVIDGDAATVNLKQIVRLSRNKKIKSISLDHKVELHQVSTVPVVGGAVTTTTTTGGLQSTNVLAANAPLVWAQGNTGQGVTVAVLDSGIAPSPDLPSAVQGVDVIAQTTVLNDKGGHGSHVAGIIAGNGTLSGGAYKGVAPGARVVSDRKSVV